MTSLIYSLFQRTGLERYPKEVGRHWAEQRNVRAEHCKPVKWVSEANAARRGACCTILPVFKSFPSKSGPLHFSSFIRKA